MEKGSPHVNAPTPMQRPSDLALQGQLRALREQRNASEDMVATMAGRVNELEHQVQEQTRVIAALQAEASKPAPPPPTEAGNG